MEEGKIYFAEGEDPRMQEAFSKAQQSFGFFWRELSWEYRRIVPGLDLAVVKVPFRVRNSSPDAPPVEHMWINDIHFDGVTINGSLLNEPQWLPDLRPGDNVSVLLSDISDWMYVCQGKVYGGFTIQAMRAAMGSSERKAHDAAWGFRFDNPDITQVTPYTGARQSSLLSRLFGARQPDAPPSALPEHPMSENMAPELDRYFQDNPAAVTEKDGDGWTLLHREALAGNLAAVQLCRKHGADLDATNNHGKRPIELAEQMGWLRVMQALS